LFRFTVFIFGAAKEDPSDIFYQSEPNDDIELLTSNMKYIDYQDQEKDMMEYLDLMKKAEDQVHRGYAVGSHCLPATTTFGQISSYLGWSVLYSARSIFPWGIPDPIEDGRLFEAMLPLDLLTKGVLMKHEDLAKDKESRFEGDLAVNKLIYVSKCISDELSLENLKENKVPEMIQKDLELPFTIDKAQYDPDYTVKVRVISKNDWGRVDWTTGNLLNPTSEPSYVDRVIVNIHGGSWIGGSSAKDLFITSQIAQETNYPIFCIDYRLAPTHKFPKGLSDCFQIYLWVQNYAEKYLQLTFGEIVLEGDSAGGNLAVGVVSQTIQRGLKVPKGICLEYP